MNLNLRQRMANLITILVPIGILLFYLALMLAIVLIVFGGAYLIINAVLWPD